VPHLLHWRFRLSNAAAPGWNKPGRSPGFSVRTLVPRNITPVWTQKRGIIMLHRALWRQHMFLLAYPAHHRIAPVVALLSPLVYRRHMAASALCLTFLPCPASAALRYPPYTFEERAVGTSFLAKLSGGLCLPCDWPSVLCAFSPLAQRSWYGNAGLLPGRCWHLPPSAFAFLSSRVTGTGLETHCLPSPGHMQTCRDWHSLFF